MQQHEVLPHLDVGVIPNLLLFLMLHTFLLLSFVLGIDEDLLIDLNDSGHTFIEIADYLDRNY
jgi:hypothetical protein